MSDKLISPIVVMNAVSLGQSQTSSGIHILYEDNFGIQFVWTGSPVGSFGVNVSNDATLTETGLVTGGTWSPYTVTSPPTPAGSAGNGIIVLNQVPFAFLQVIYTFTSGTGSVTATLVGKSV